MKLIASALPLLSEGSELTIKLSRKAGEIHLQFTPKLGTLDTETEDETLGKFQTALLRPLLIKLPDSPDPDEALASLLEGFIEERQPTVDALTAYRQVQEDARKEAAAAEKKAKDAREAKAKEKKEPKTKPATTKVKKAGKGKTPPAEGAEPKPRGKPGPKPKPKPDPGAAVATAGSVLPAVTPPVIADLFSTQAEAQP